MSSSGKVLFGPVPSRRLGRSLGIDVTPFKTCSFDCVFCQCGCTTQLQTGRDEFVPLQEVCAELERWLATGGDADCITLAGSGEPTLYSRLGDLIRFIKSKTAIRLIVLSNGTLLSDPEVRRDLMEADTVKVSLSAWDEASFRRINRPAAGLSFEQVIAGLQAFRQEFRGELWLEIFLMEGINAEPEQVARIAGLTRTIRPDRIHLNTAVRPPADRSVRPVPEEKLRALCALFTPPAEVIASFAATLPRPAGEVSEAGLLDLIRRHPATAAQLAAVTGGSPAEITALLNRLTAAGTLQTAMQQNELCYCIPR